MRNIQIFFAVAITLSLMLVLNTRMGGVPPLGKFLDPVNGFWVNSENTALTAPAQKTLRGLEKDVVIYWDKMLVPHIQAASDKDLYFAQGYTTAFHRLWQMEFQLFKTEGRLSEVLGSLTQEFDRAQRRKGLKYAAQNMWEETKRHKKSRETLEAYAAGVNAYINSLSHKDYPLEYKLLDYAPEPWSPYKSCLLAKEMADILSLDDRDIENTYLMQALGQETFDLLFPDSHEGIDYIIPAGTSFDFLPEELTNPVEDSLALSLPLFHRETSSHGSNHAVVGPQKTSDGSVLFANEPDLDLNLPSLWYLVHLTSPTVNVMGGSVPGAPGVLIGFNDSLAWGLTNAERDLSDWYNVQFRNQERKEYLYNQAFYKTATHIEAIKVRDKKTYYDTVIYTHHGPVYYDRNYGKDLKKGVNLALRWTGHDASNDLLAFYYLSRAYNYTDFTYAISWLATPPQNICVGTTSGDIGLWVQGKYPLKWKGQGKFVMDGRRPDHDWQGFIPQEHHIHHKNPERGFVASANQHPADQAYPYYVYSHNYEYFRGRRLNERLRTMQNIRAEDMISLQNDNFNYIAYESLGLMLDSLETSSLDIENAKLYQTLQSWDFFNHANRIAPVYFEIWYDSLYAMIWDEFTRMQGPLYLPSDYHTLYLMRQHPTLPFFDIANTPEKEHLGMLINASFMKIKDALRAWEQTHEGASLQWSSFKKTNIRHLLRIAPFSSENITVGGNHHIVNAVKKHHGPSLRLVVKLSKTDGVHAWGVYPGGQVGNPGNIAYAQWIDRWAEGKYFELLFTTDKQALRQEAILTQTLKAP